MNIKVIKLADGRVAFKLPKNASKSERDMISQFVKSEKVLNFVDGTSGLVVGMADVNSPEFDSSFTKMMKKRAGKVNSKKVTV